MPERLVMLENFEYDNGKGLSCKYKKHCVYGVNHAERLPEDVYVLIGSKPDPENDDLFPPEPEPEVDETELAELVDELGEPDVPMLDDDGLDDLDDIDALL
jgi:hypothetical protein